MTIFIHMNKDKNPSATVMGLHDDGDESNQSASVTHSDCQVHLSLAAPIIPWDSASQVNREESLSQTVLPLLWKFSFVGLS